MDIFKTLGSLIGRKNSQTTRLISKFINNGSTAPKEGREFDFAKEGYNETVMVFACVREIAVAFSGIKWCLFRMVGGEKQEVTDHPLIDLWRRPNPHQGSTSFLLSVASHYCIAGNSYIEAATDSLSVPQYLYSLRPDRMSVIPDIVDRIGGYRYKANGEAKDFVDGEILHFKDFSPTSDWYGLSAIGVAALSIDSFKGQQQWNKSLLDHGGQPSGILTIEDDLHPTAVDNLREDFKRKHQGSGNAYEPFIAEGGKMKWESIGLNATELDFIESQKLSSSQIAQVFNVPGELVGLLPATYSNRREARKALYTEVVLPMLDRFRDDFNNWLPPMFGTDDLFFEPDLDDIEAMQEDREALWKRLDASEDLTLNERRVSKGYDETDDGDVIFVSSSKLPLSDALDPFGSLPETEKPDDEPSDDDVPDPFDKGFELGGEEGDYDFGGEAKQARVNRAEVLAVGRMRKKFDRRMAKQVRSLFKKELSGIMDALDRFGGQAQANIDQVIDDLKNDWEDAIITNRKLVMDAFGKRQLRKFKKENNGFEVKATAEDIFQAEIRLASRLHVADQIAGISSTTKKRIRKLIGDGLAVGKSVEEITVELQSLYKGFSVGRANTIALTETVTAQNRGSLEAMNSLKIPLLKVWAWSGITGEHERKGHHDADGQSVQQEEMFRVSPDGGSFESLLHPGDPSASAGNRINCHCALTYRRDVENDDR